MEVNSLSIRGFTAVLQDDSYGNYVPVLSGWNRRCKGSKVSAVRNRAQKPDRWALLRNAPASCSPSPRAVPAHRAPAPSRTLAPREAEMKSAIGSCFGLFRKWEFHFSSPRRYQQGALPPSTDVEATDPSPHQPRQ